MFACQQRNSSLMMIYYLEKTKNHPDRNKVLVLPKKLIPQILYNHHDSVQAGHPSVQRTHGGISNLHYFKRMKKIIYDYVRSRMDC